MIDYGLFAFRLIYLVNFRFAFEPQYAVRNFFPLTRRRPLRINNFFLCVVWLVV